VRKRNPIVFIFVGVAVLLGLVLVLGNARRAQQDPALATTTSRPATITPSTLRAATSTTKPGTPTSAATAARPTTTATLAPGVTVPKGMRSVRESALPPEARTTLALIASDGPFPHDQDGVVFQNREKLLPTKANGYYHEYTVETPGSADRGARRVITGAAGERYYTDDHYGSFRWVVP